MEGEVSANIVAYLALILWFPATLIIFWRFRPTIALAVAVFGAILFLPERVGLYNPPLLPILDKQVIATLSIFVGCLISAPVRRCLGRLSKLELACFAFLIFVSDALTAMTNTDRLTYGLLNLPAMTTNDALATSVGDMLQYLVPFFAAKAIYRSSKDVRDLMIVVVGFAGIYSLFVLVEARMSPQMNYWVYGYHQHAFIQTYRLGGWRPMVFMHHGLSLAIFFVGALLFSAVLARRQVKIARFSTRLWMGFLSVMLLICRSLGAIIYGVVFLPLVLLFKGRALTWIGVILASVVLLFPWLRAAGLLPTEEVVAFAADYYPERSASLGFRFDNEDLLLEKASQRRLFGWGIYGRSRVYDDDGRDVAVTDGCWIIQLGVRGVFGYLIVFGLLLYPIFTALYRSRRLKSSDDSLILGVMALLLGIRSVELLPNGLFSFLPFFFSGALAGLASGLAHQKAAKNLPSKGAHIIHTPDGGTIRPHGPDGIIYRPPSRK